MKTIKCPHCGSKDVLMWQEENITYYYKVKKNGERYKWPSYSFNSSSSMPYGYKCDVCGEYGYSDDLEAWEQESMIK